MAYSAQQLRITWGFEVAGSPETAFTGLSLSQGTAWAGAGAAVAELDATDLGNLASRMSALMSENHLNWADYSKLVTVKVAALDTDGEYIVAAGNPKLFDVGVIDQGTQDSVPPQCSIVISLRTVTTLGKGNYGRMYLPHTRWSYDDQTVTPVSSAVSTISTAAAAFINGVSSDVNAGITDAVLPVIMGQTGSGTTKTITRVAVGSVVDTQRRRRRQLPETYAFTTL